MATFGFRANPAQSLKHKRTTTNNKDYNKMGLRKQVKNDGKMDEAKCKTT